MVSCCVVVVVVVSCCVVVVVVVSCCVVVVVDGQLWFLRSSAEHTGGHSVDTVVR